MKKITALLLFAALVFSLCACSGANKDNKETAANAETKAAETDAVTNADTKAIAEDTSAEDTDDAPYEPGEVSGSTYISKYFGFGCEFGDGWDVSGRSADENIPTDKDVIYELDAKNAENTESVRIVVKNMGTQGAQLNEKSYLNTQSDSFRESVEGSGAENISIEVLPVEFADDFHYALSASGEINGKPMEEYAIAVQRGTYFANIIIDTLNGNTEEMISSFFAVD